MIQIDKGIPIPESHTGIASKYPFRDMELGDSFAVGLNGRSVKVAQITVSGAARKWSVRFGGKFATRKLTENGVVVIRCWRVA